MYGYAFGGHDKSEVLDLLHLELAFFSFQVETRGFQRFQDLANVGVMSFESIGVNQNVVDVGGTENVQIFLEDIVDEVRELGRGICESEGHHHPFEVSKAGGKSRFPFFPFGCSYQVVCPSKV